MLVATDPDTEKKAAAGSTAGAAGRRSTASSSSGPERGSSSKSARRGPQRLQHPADRQHGANARADRRAAGVRSAGRGVGAGMLEGSTPNAVAAGSRVTVNGPFPPGNTVVQFAYSLAARQRHDHDPPEDAGAADASQPGRAEDRRAAADLAANRRSSARCRPKGRTTSSRRGGACRRRRCWRSR